MKREEITRGDFCSTVTQYTRVSAPGGEYIMRQHYLCVAGHFIHFLNSQKRDEIFKAIEEHGCGESGATGCLSWGDRKIRQLKGEEE